MYSRNCRTSKFYYETIQVNVETAGFYSLSSKSNINTYGYLYNDAFNPFNPSENLNSENSYKCNGEQFKLDIYLQPSATYVLVVTTYFPKVTGTFLIFAFGPNNITLNHNSEWIYTLWIISTKYRNCLLTQFSLLIHKKI